MRQMVSCADRVCCGCYGKLRRVAWIACLRTGHCRGLAVNMKRHSSSMYLQTFNLSPSVYRLLKSLTGNSSLVPLRLYESAR